jgi:hypothetical protein
VKFTGLDATASVDDDVKRYDLTALQVCRPTCRTARRIFARRGETINFKAFLTPTDGSEERVVDFTFRVPRHAHAGALVQVGAPTLPDFCFAPEKCATVIDSLDRLLQMFSRQLPNDVLHGTLRAGQAGKVKQRQDEVFDRVVSGTEWVRIFLRGDCCPPDPVLPAFEGEF